MGKQKQAGGKPKGGYWMATVDPARVRFAFSRIRPYFSGCGRKVEDTLQDIRDGKLDARDLPAITVMDRPDSGGGDKWYFSLNNRRLWVLKRAADEGLLGGAGGREVEVRVRAMRPHELKKYTLETCACEAKFLYAAGNGDVPDGTAEGDRDGAAAEEEDEEEGSGDEGVMRGERERLAELIARAAEGPGLALEEARELERLRRALKKAGISV
ncbi:unnamed protein product [Pedinophyceae sp. YPF-701]|nr:unnamed protein product [Pedinophyceae sp. YPF-701]